MFFLMFKDNISMIFFFFVKQFVYKMFVMKEFFELGDWEVKIEEKKIKYGIKNNFIQVVIFILNLIYGIDFLLFEGMVMIYCNIYIGLEKYY